MGVDFLHEEPDRTIGDLFTAYVNRKVTQVSSMTDIHPKILEKSPRYRGSRSFAPEKLLEPVGPIYSLCSWRSHPGIEDDEFTF